MNQDDEKETARMLRKAAQGDREALGAAVSLVQDMVFNLSLRMLGTFADAEDASQEILMKIVRGLPSFKGESAFSTWAFSIAANHLKSFRRHQFAKMPLTFEIYGGDIKNADVSDIPDLTQDVGRDILAEELKYSCTNVMLQCLDAESRCIFILGTMFRPDSRIAAEILGISAEAYRQRLSRARRKMADFLGEYCGECGGGSCRCGPRVGYAIQNGRLSPERLDFTSGVPKRIRAVKEAMEDIDGLSAQFSVYKTYESPERLKRRVKDFLDGDLAAAVMNA
ncbi:MAG: RNA polymerase sigma factor [Treponemataceae bacterium]|nr:RNA polymerase sigma factor [Treponemataceae bacterium]